jgi:hypothetical protein
MADNITALMCRLSRNLGASTSWNPKGLSRPVMGLLYHYLRLGPKIVRIVRFNVVFVLQRHKLSFMSEGTAG